MGHIPRWQHMLFSCNRCLSDTLTLWHCLGIAKALVHGRADITYIGGGTCIESQDVNTGNHCHPITHVTIILRTNLPSISWGKRHSIPWRVPLWGWAQGRWGGSITGGMAWRGAAKSGRWYHDMITARERRRKANNERTRNCSNCPQWIRTNLSFVQVFFLIWFIKSSSSICIIKVRTQAESGVAFPTFLRDIRTRVTKLTRVLGIANLGSCRYLKSQFLQSIFPTRNHSLVWLSRFCSVVVSTRLSVCSCLYLSVVGNLQRIARLEQTWQRTLELI